MILVKDVPVGYKSADALRYAIEKHLEKGVIKIPMMPQVASRVMAVINDPNVDLADLSAMIHRDPSLAARVLQVANSAAYRGSEEIGSLQEAVNRLGIRALCELILSASLRAGIYRVPGFEREVNLLWRHSLASGLFGRELGRLQGVSEETTFLCGLLHAIGKPAVLQIIADFTKQHQFLVKPEVLDQLLEEFHWRISVLMAEQWNLPQPVVVTCRYYRDYGAAPACQQDAALTYLADRLANWITWPERVDVQSLQQDRIFESLHFDDGQVQRVFELRESVQTVVTAMDK